MDKYKCLKTVILEGQSTPSFIEGSIYETTIPDVWPDPKINICLINEQGENHFMYRPWFIKYFEIISHEID